ncbi:MAG: DUF302 domain-containing protein [bacterium]|jgi:uncharacterized protein (DUF302 family)
MNYYLSKTLSDIEFESAIEQVTEELKKVGFGVLTEIDVQSTFKDKLDVDFRKYRILGACNPGFAHKALQSDLHAGTMLPCNVVVMEHDNGQVEISIVDPVASMMAVKDETVQSIAREVKEKMKSVIETL